VAASTDASLLLNERKSCRMFSESAEIYDLIYGEFKDYRAESGQVAEMLREVHPAAHSVLDVGCGTGQHASFLGDEHGYRVDGLDIEPSFLELARGRCPEGTFFQGDMAEFHLQRRYDVVLCLFSSIGYVKTSTRLASAARCLWEHVTPGGVAVVEPWFPPGGFTGGSVRLHTVEKEDLKICRISRSEVRDRVSWIEFQYLVARPGEIRHLREVHELGLFTDTEMREALESAGFEILHHDDAGFPGDRGLFVARRENDGNPPR
jgi:SAM-dependent methyltransferase